MFYIRRLISAGTIQSELFQSESFFLFWRDFWEGSWFLLTPCVSGGTIHPLHSGLTYPNAQWDPMLWLESPQNGVLGPKTGLIRAVCPPKPKNSGTGTH